MGFRIIPYFASAPYIYIYIYIVSWQICQISFLRDFLSEQIKMVSLSPFDHM